MSNQSNRNRILPQADVINISNRAITNIKAVLFELHDRALCDETPTQADLDSIDAAVLRSLRVAREDAAREKKHHDKQSLPDMVVIQLTTKNCLEFKVSVGDLLSVFMEAMGLLCHVSPELRKVTTLMHLKPVWLA